MQGQIAKEIALMSGFNIDDKEKPRKKSTRKNKAKCLFQLCQQLTKSRMKLMACCKTKFIIGRKVLSIYIYISQASNS